jgi:hypothetical protein
MQDSLPLYAFAELEPRREATVEGAYVSMGKGTRQDAGLNDFLILYENTEILLAFASLVTVRLLVIFVEKT